MLTLTRYATRKLIAKEEHVIGMFGLNNAGKTSFFLEIKRNFGIETSERPLPTIGFHPFAFPMGKQRFKIYDVGGQLSFRPVWEAYYPEVDGILFIIDSSDPSRFGEAVKELRRIVENNNCQYVPICIAANKQDMPDTTLPTDFKDIFALEDFLEDKSTETLLHSYTVIGTKADNLIEGGTENVMECLHWFQTQFETDELSKRRIRWRKARRVEQHVDEED